MHRAFAGGLALVLLCGTAAVAAEIKILSAGAVEPGLRKAVERFKQATGHEVKIQFKMQLVINGSGRQLGFGAITEIKLFEAKGIKFVGPLPADIQNYTTYGAALTANGPEPAAAKAFVAFLATAEARQLFAAAGVE